VTSSQYARLVPVRTPVVERTALTDGHAVGERVAPLVRHHHTSVVAELRPNDGQFGGQFIGEAGGTAAIGEYQAVAVVHRAGANKVEVESRHTDCKNACMSLAVWADFRWRLIKLRRVGSNRRDGRIH